MAGKGSKKDIESVLMQAMLAAKTVRAQRDRLLLLQHRLQDLQADADKDKDKLGELASNLFKVYYIGLEAGARMLTTCVRLAAEKGIYFSQPNMAFAVMNDEQLHDALLAQQFPARPRSQAQGLDRVMAAVLAIKLLEEHLLPRCVQCLAGGKAPVPGKTPDPSPDSSPDPVVAATEALAKVDLSDDPDAAKTAKSGASEIIVPYWRFYKGLNYPFSIGKRIANERSSGLKSPWEMGSAGGSSSKRARLDVKGLPDWMKTGSVQRVLQGQEMSQSLGFYQGLARSADGGRPRSAAAGDVVGRSSCRLFGVSLTEQKMLAGASEGGGRSSCRLFGVSLTEQKMLAGASEGGAKEGEADDETD